MRLWHSRCICALQETLEARPAHVGLLRSPPLPSAPRGACTKARSACPNIFLLLRPTARAVLPAGPIFVRNMENVREVSVGGIRDVVFANGDARRRSGQNPA